MQENQHLNIDDASNFVNDSSDTIIIKAVGVGGGGNNAVNHMFRQGINNVSFVNINTDRQALKSSQVPRLQIGNGLGAGNKPEVAQAAAEEAADQINSLFDDDTKMVFITAGMGGGTGTGAAPVVARIAKERGLLTIGIVTIPFLFEGRKKIVKALEGADEMSKYVDALLVINNERLTEIYGDYSLINAFAKADDTLTIAARSISELITCEGQINLDFKDVDTTLRDGGAAIISTGYGEGENRVTKAIEDALHSPLLKDCDIIGSKKLLFNLYFSRKSENELKMEEANELTNFISSIDPGVDVIWGIGYDDSLGDTVKITILAAGFNITIQDDDKPMLTPQQPKPVQKRREPQIETIRKLEKEYGSRFSDMDNVRQRYIILRPNQFDDDSITEILEKTPTYTRDKKIVDAVVGNTGSISRAADRPAADSTRSIDFNAD